MKSTAPPTLLVLAAGMGSRYGGLKQIDSVGPGGETIIDYSMYDAIRAGFGKVVFVIRKDIEQAFTQAVGRDLKGISESNTSFRNSINFRWDFPSRPAAPSHGARYMQF